MLKKPKREHVSDLFDLLSKTRFQIFTFLNMYGKLSLTEIAQKLNKSKSTIHGHIKKMKNADALIEEKRPIYTDPNSDKPKVFENVYTINPEFGTEFEDIIPGLNLENLTVEQAKIIIDTLTFITKMRIANLRIQQQFYNKIENTFETEPEKM
ncbi:MAG: ArsR/SmtB family transcription factor, partial [Candidatus Hodarchaeota archaeon]